MSGLMRSIGRVFLAAVRGVGGEVWFSVAGFGRLVRRYTVATVASSAWLVVTAWQAWWNLFVLLAVPVLAFAGWRRVGPVSFGRWVSDRLWRHRSRRWVRKRWPMIADSCGLARRTAERDGTPAGGGPGLGRVGGGGGGGRGGGRGGL